jgi:RNA polymerase sigma-70 factor, ECF subfamily
MLGNEADALDATQDALVAAIRAIGRFDGRSSFGTWLYRIATNTCIDEIRRRRRRPMTGITADVAEVADEISFGAPGLFVTPPRPVARTAEVSRGVEDGSAGSLGSAGHELTGRGSARPGTGTGAVGGTRDPADIVAARVDIDAALRSLPVEFRTAVVLRDVCDLPYEEISEILGVPVGTVRSRIARARAALAATWQTDKAESLVSSEGAPVAPGNDSVAPDVRTRDNARTRPSQEEEHTP